MARTYTPAALAAPDVKSLVWARTWVRATLRDTPNEHGAYPAGSYLDAEIEGQLALLSVLGTDSVRLYAPHVVAASMLETDPRRVLSFSVGGLSETLPDAKTAADAIRRNGAIDALIIDAGGTPPVGGGTRRVESVF